MAGGPRDPVFATCREGHAVGREVVVTVGPNVLLFFWHGYADPASLARPATRFECARGLLAEIGSDLLFATSASRRTARSSAWVHRQW